jgi:hypothetical protein
MHERYPGLNLFNSRHTAQLDRRCLRITPPTRHLIRADLARRSATILASEPPPEVILGLVTTFQWLRSTSGVPNAPRPQLYGRRTQEPLHKARSPWAKLSPARAQERLFVFFRGTRLHLIHSQWLCGLHFHTLISSPRLVRAATRGERSWTRALGILPVYHVANRRRR